MKRYLLFLGDKYYPLGGWEDFKGDFDSVEDAVRAKSEHAYAVSGGWWQVVDALTYQITESGYF